MSSRLIVPRGYADGKRNVRAEVNPFARILRRRASPTQKRFVGPVWKDVGPLPDEHPGRRFGQVVGNWISELVELGKAIVLCELCTSKFYYKRAHYYKDGRYGPRAHATCDGCREYTLRGQIYLPEERLIDASGVPQPGQCWSPR